MKHLAERLELAEVTQARMAPLPASIGYNSQDTYSAKRLSELKAKVAKGRAELERAQAWKARLEEQALREQPQQALREQPQQAFVSVIGKGLSVRFKSIESKSAFQNPQPAASTAASTADSSADSTAVSTEASAMASTASEEPLSSHQSVDEFLRLRDQISELETEMKNLKNQLEAAEKLSADLRHQLEV